jgi:hypothetical protein
MQQRISVVPRDCCDRTVVEKNTVMQQQQQHWMPVLHDWLYVCVMDNATS